MKLRLEKLRNNHLILSGSSIGYSHPVLISMDMLYNVTAEQNSQGMSGGEIYLFAKNLEIGQSLTIEVTLAEEL